MILAEKGNLSVETIRYRPIHQGGGGWPLINDWLENWAWQDGIFSPLELDAIINIGKDTGLNQASTFGGTDEKVRNSEVSFIYPNDMTSWVFSRLTQAIHHVNANFFDFDLYTMEQGLQFTEYKAPGQHYEWHIDRGMMAGNRKLSMAMQLSDPDEYEGGDLEVWFGGDPIKLPRVRGRAFFFPSYVMHRVNPVTEGTRHSLVCWISGPKFK